MKTIAALMLMSTPAFAGDCMDWGAPATASVACVVDAGERVELRVHNTLTFANAFVMETVTSPLGRSVVVRVDNTHGSAPDRIRVEAPLGFVVVGPDEVLVEDGADVVIVFVPVGMS